MVCSFEYMAVKCSSSWRLIYCCMLGAVADPSCHRGKNGARLRQTTTTRTHTSKEHSATQAGLNPEPSYSEATMLTARPVLVFSMIPAPPNVTLCTKQSDKYHWPSCQNSHMEKHDSSLQRTCFPVVWLCSSSFNLLEKLAQYPPDPIEYELILMQKITSSGLETDSKQIDKDESWLFVRI